jgi:hypothetical protein
MQLLDGKIFQTFYKFSKKNVYIILAILRSKKLLSHIQTIAANSFISLILAKENREPSLLNSKRAFTGGRDLYVSYKLHKYLFAVKKVTHMSDQNEYNIYWRSPSTDC